MDCYIHFYFPNYVSHAWVQDSEDGEVQKEAPSVILCVVSVESAKIM